MGHEQMEGPRGQGMPALSAFLATLALGILVGACSSPQRVPPPAHQEAASTDVTAWAYDLRLTEQQWRLAREASLLAGNDDPSASRAAAAAGLIERDALRMAILKHPPQSLEDLAREVGARPTGLAAVTFLAQAAWYVDEASASGDPSQRARAEELLNMADAAMLQYQQGTQRVLALRGLRWQDGSIR